MPTLEVEIKTVGASEAATDIKDVGDAAKQAGGDIKSAGSDISSTSQSLGSFKSNLAGVVGSFTAVATSVLGLVRNFTQLEQAQVRLDTANRKVETSAQAVEAAQKKLNDQIRKYGENSTEAKTAADKLKTTIEGHNIAVDRAQLQQSKFNETLASLATEIAPQVIGIFGSIVGAISSFTTKGEGGVTLAGKLKGSFTELLGPLGSLTTSFGSLGSIAGTAFAGIGLGLAVFETVNVVLQQAKGYIDAFRDASKGNTQGVADDFNRMMSSLQNLPIGGWIIGVMQQFGLLPPMSQDTASKVVAGWANVGAQIQQGFSNLASNLQFVWTTIQQGAAQVPGWINTNVVQPLMNIPSQLQNLGSQIYQKIITGWTALTQWITTNVIQPIQAIPSQLGSFGQQIYNKIIEGWQNLTAWVNTNIIQPIKAAPNNLGAQGPSLYNKVIEGWTALTQWVTDNIVKPIQNGPAAIGALGTQIRAKIIEGWVALTDWIKTNITEPLGKFTDDLKANGAEIWNKLSSGWKDLQDWVTNNIVDPLVGFIDNIKAVGSEIWNKLSQGWQDLTGWIQEHIIKPLQDIPNNLPAIGNQIWAKLLEASGSFQDKIKQIADQLANLGKGDVLANLKNLFTGVVQQVDPATGAVKAFGVAAGDTGQQVDKLTQKNQELGAKLGELNSALTTTAGQAKLASQGILEQQTALATAETALVSGAAALTEYNNEVERGETFTAAFGKGILEMANQLLDSSSKLGEAEGKLTALVTALGTAKGKVEEFNSGFASGIDDVIKWADNLAQAQGKVEGTRAALETILPTLKVEFPAGVNLSNKAMMDFAGAVTSGSDTITKTLQDADKLWISILDDFNKAAAQAPKDQSKAWADFKKAQTDAFADLQKALQSHTGNQQQAWNTYYQKIQEAQNKFNADSQQSWTKYFEDLNSKLSRPLTAGEQALVQSMARMSDIMKKGIATLETDLEGMKLGLPESATNMQRDFTDLIGKMEDALKTLPTQAQTSYQSLIDMVNKLPASTQEDWNKKISALNVIYGAILNPSQSFATTSEQVGKALTGIQGTTADKPVSQLGGAAQSTTPLLDSFTTQLGNAGTAIQTFMTSLPTNISAQLASLPAAVNTAFVQPFVTGLGQIGTTVQTGMQALATNLPGQLAGIAASVQTGLVQPFITAMGSIGTTVQTAMQALASNVGAQLAGVAASVQTSFVQPFVTGMGQIGSTVQTGMQALASNIGAQLQGVSQAVQTGFVQPFVTGMGQIGSTVQTGMQALAGNITGQLAGVAAAVQTGFVQPFITGMGQIGSTVQTGMQALAANIGAQLAGVSQAVQTSFVQPFVTGVGTIGTAVQTAMQALVSNIGSQLSGLPGVIQQSLVTPFQNGAQQAAQSVQQAMQQIQQSVQQAMQSAGQAVQQFVQTINQIPRSINIVVNVDTSAAQQKIAALQQQLNALNQGVAGGGYPTTSPYGYPVYGATGGEFALTPGGFKRTKQGEELHAAQGGSFVVTKQTRLANLTVGEGNKPELLTFRPGKSGHGIGMLIVTPIPKRKLHAQAGGAFPVFGSAPGPGLFPGAGFPTGNPLQYPGAPIDYGAGLPVPVQGQGGVPETTLGQYGAPSFGTITSGGTPFGGFGFTGGYTVEPQTGLPIEYNQQGAPVSATGGGGLAPSGAPSGAAQNVSPYEMAQMTGQSVASAQAPLQQQMQSDIAELLAVIRRLIAKISMRDINANLMIDGQKMASTVSKYIGSGAYGGR